MKKQAWLIAATGAVMIAAAAHASTTLTILGTDDIYNAGNPGSDPGTDPSGVDVTGLTAVTVSNASGQVYLNLTSGDNLNDPDGGGAAPSSSSNSGDNFIAGLTAPDAGYITGVFLGPTVSATTPAPLDFSGGTSFSTLAPQLQQAFFIGDGLTGDGNGAVQTFYVPAGATTLYLGISDACGYNGSPSCYDDNGGSFSITVNGSSVPEPASWALMIVGLSGLGGALRTRRIATAAV